MNEIEFYLEDLKSKFSKINPKEYCLSYSGGKDSHFLYWFIKEYLKDTDIEIVGINTYMEHKQILERIYKNCDIVLLPTFKPFEIKKKYGSPCFTKTQDEMINRYQKGNKSKNTMKFIKGDNIKFNLNNYARGLLLENKLHNISNKCCLYLKKKPMQQYLKKTSKKLILGVRQEESINRKAQYTSCFRKDGTFTPIFDLTTELLNLIEIKYNIEIPNIYKYIDRTGCMGCPYGRNIELELQLINNKNKRNFIIKYHKESYDVKNINYNQTTIFDFMEE